LGRFGRGVTLAAEAVHRARCAAHRAAGAAPLRGFRSPPACPGPGSAWRARILTPCR